MQANTRDAASLWDMAQAIREIQEFTANLSQQDYLESTLVQKAVERELEILGEAARRISEDFRQAHSEVNWRNIVGLRNIVAHRYDRVDQDIIWNVVTSLLPKLLAQIEALLPPLPQEEQ